MALSRRVFALSGLSCAALQAEPQRPLVLLVDSATEWPMARFAGDSVVGGMSLELGQLLAGQLGRPVRAIARPRRRMLRTLVEGEADWVCTYLQAWLPGPLRWSKGFFLQEDVIVSRADHARPQRLRDLRGRRIGTVLGFVYPELESALGVGFVREDAPSSEANLRKLAAGRVAHAAVSRRALDVAVREGLLRVAVHPALPVARPLTQCALGPHAPLPIEQLDQAIDAIQRDGSLQALYRRYAADDSSTRSSSRP